MPYFGSISVTVAALSFSMNPEIEIFSPSCKTLHASNLLLTVGDAAFS